MTTSSAPAGNAGSTVHSLLAAPPRLDAAAFEAALAAVKAQQFSQPGAAPGRPGPAAAGAPLPNRATWELETSHLPAEVTQAIAANQVRHPLAKQMCASWPAEARSFNLTGLCVIKVETPPGGRPVLTGEIAYPDARSGQPVGRYTLSQSRDLAEGSLYAHDMTHTGSQLGVNLHLADEPARQTNGLVNEALNDGFFEAVKTHGARNPAFAAALLAATRTTEGAKLQEVAENSTGYGAASGADPRSEDRIKDYRSFARGKIFGHIHTRGEYYETTNVAERAVARRFEALFDSDPGFAATYARTGRRSRRRSRRCRPGRPPRRRRHGSTW